MAEIPELQEFCQIHKNFNNLDLSNLYNEELLCAEKTEKIIFEIDEKLEIIDELDAYLEKLEEELGATNEDIETLDVEIIRTKSQIKKCEKQVSKLGEINASQVTIDATERDKLKMRTSASRLALTRRLLGVQLNKDKKGILTDSNGQLKILQVNKNQSKEINREHLWNEIFENSTHKEDWQMLFQTSPQQ